MKVELTRVNPFVHLEAVNEDGIVVDIDGSPNIGGQNLGVRPMQLLLMGLGGCSSMDVLTILRKQKITVDDYKVNITAERDTDNVPALFTDIHVEFILHGDIDPDKAERAVSLSMEKYCSVTKILEKTANITHSVVINP